MKLVIVTLPFPDKDLNPNRANGKHWSVTSGLRKKAKHAGWVLGLEAAHRAGWKSHGQDVPLRITFEVPDRRCRDSANPLAPMKPSVDGIALAPGEDASQFESMTLRSMCGREFGAVHLDMGIWSRGDVGQRTGYSLGCSTRIIQSSVVTKVLEEVAV